MKKEVWDIEKLPNGEFILSSCGDELTTKDLKDLRSLIDTVLGEEKGSKKYIQEPQGWTVPNYSQPLTEGEGKIPCLCPKWFSDGMGGYVKNIFPANEHVEPCPLLKPQQESNKEECKNESGLCIPEDGLHFMECPSHYKNKEMPRCGGLGCKFPPQHPGACYPGVSQEPSKKEENTIHHGGGGAMGGNGRRFTPSKNPMCYCGHPEEKHKPLLPSDIPYGWTGGDRGRCVHCSCRQFDCSNTKNIHIGKYCKDCFLNDKIFWLKERCLNELHNKGKI